MPWAAIMKNLEAEEFELIPPDKKVDADDPRYGPEVHIVPCKFDTGDPKTLCFGVHEFSESCACHPTKEKQANGRTIISHKDTEAAGEHPRFRLDEIEERLAATPSYMLAQRKLLELQVKALKKQTSADYGRAERNPERTSEAEQKNSGAAFAQLTAHFGVVPITHDMGGCPGCS